MHKIVNKEVNRGGNLMDKENLIKFGLITLIFVLCSLVFIHFQVAYERYVSIPSYWIAYWTQSLMYGLIGVVLGIKSFRNKINWHMKVSDVVLICILGILILHPFYVYLLPAKLCIFLSSSNVQIVSSMVLGHLIGRSVN